MTEKTQAAEPKKVTKAAPKEVESVYSADELAKAYKVLNASYAIVATALKLAKKDSATLKEAQKIVDEFKNKEV